jgi:replicative DNA helicase
MSQQTDVSKLIHRNGSERALITICLTNPNKLIEVASLGLTPDMFASPAHRYIYMAMQYLTSRDQQVDPVSILNVFSSDDAKNAINEVGGIDYIEAMTQSHVNPNLELYVGHIMQAAARRAIYTQAEKMKKRALEDEDTELSQYLGEAENDVREVSLKYTSNKEVYKMGDRLSEKLKQRATNPDPIPGLKVGWKSFDKATLGLKPGELTIVGARSKVGKSVTLMNWAKKIGIDDQVPTLYIDTEMTEDEQEDRLLAMVSGVPESEIKTGMFTKDTWAGKARDKIKALQEASKKIREGKLFHIYMPHFTIETVMALARKYQIKESIQSLFFDYIKLPSSDSSNSAQEYQLLGYFTSGLKDLAGLLEIPVISGVQLNRAAVNAEKMDESMVAGSDRILQLANRLCFLRNKTEEEFALEGGQVGGNQKFKIAFQRGGASDVDEFNINFDRPILRQTEVEG